MTRIGILVTHIRAEEKLLVEAFREAGVEPDMILDRDLNMDVTGGADQLAPTGIPWSDYNMILERSVSTSRGTYALMLLNTWGVPTINTYQTAHICGDKLATSAVLAAAGVPQPNTRVAFTPDSAMDAIDDLTYPAVMKPVTGSWGRLLARVSDRTSAESIIEHRQVLGNYQHHVYYAQEYVEKPGRDIRAFVIGGETVCAIYRESSHWITNTARGGQASNCPVTDEINDICVRAAEAVGGGILAIDLLEDPERGYLVNEINHTMEFRNSSKPTGVDIAARVAAHVIELAEANRTRALA
ncbi:MAG: lysine biosynthesis protein LysX [Chloroflexota bacterium]